MKLDQLNIDILELMRTGLTVKEIAPKVFRSHRTVEARVLKLRKLTGSKSYGQLIDWFIKSGKSTVESNK